MTASRRCCFAGDRGVPFTAFENMYCSSSIILFLNYCSNSINNPIKTRCCVLVHRAITVPFRKLISYDEIAMILSSITSYIIYARALGGALRRNPSLFPQRPSTPHTRQRGLIKQNIPIRRPIVP